MGDLAMRIHTKHLVLAGFTLLLAAVYVKGQASNSQGSNGQGSNGQGSNSQGSNGQGSNGQGFKFAGDLGNANPNATIDVIVQYKAPPGPAQHQKAALWGGQLKKLLNHIKGAVYTMPAGLAAQFARDNDVAYISPDRPLRRMLNLS